MALRFVEIDCIIIKKKTSWHVGIFAMLTREQTNDYHQPYRKFMYGENIHARTKCTELRVMQPKVF